MFTVESRRVNRGAEGRRRNKILTVQFTVNVEVDNVGVSLGLHLIVMLTVPP